VPPNARKVHAAGIPDMRYINRDLPIVDVARALDLRLDGTGKIHCWHPDRHQQGDRTASVGIWKSNNAVKCFGCDSKLMGPIDLVMDVVPITSPADAALWIAERFDVPKIPARRRLTEADRWRGPVGYECGLDLLVRSGLWGELSEAAQSIAPVLWARSERNEPTAHEFSVRISYLGITRYSGVRSPNAIRRALIELSEIGFLALPETGGRRGPNRPVSEYKVTPNSDQLYELAQVFSAQMKTEIAAERELRARVRAEKARALRERQKDSIATSLQHAPVSGSEPENRQGTENGSVGTKYKPLYSTDSAKQQHAIPAIA